MKHINLYDRLCLFAGNRVWRYNQNNTLERGFPQKSSALGIPANIQAAMQWGRDGLIYVFKSKRNFVDFKHKKTLF